MRTLHQARYARIHAETMQLQRAAAERERRRRARTRQDWTLFVLSVALFGYLAYAIAQWVTTQGGLS